jgi:hypothetical protein
MHRTRLRSNDRTAEYHLRKVFTKLGIRQTIAN